MYFWDVMASAIQHSTVERPLWRMSPTQFMREVLEVRPWKGQRKINQLVAEGHKRISVYTGHGVGKTLDAAALVCWAVGCADPPYTVVTTAPTFRQVRDQLWREVNRLWTSSDRLRALGECLTTRLECAAGHYAVGFSTKEPGRFQGIHAPRILFIVDEANALPEPIWEAIDACMVNRSAQVLSVGNPIVPYGHFFRDKDRLGVKLLTISSREHPNVRSGRELIPGAVTQEWIEDFEEEYATRPGAVASRIDGVFPAGSSDSIVSRDLFRASMHVVPRTMWPSVLGVDVARYGTNFTTSARQTGQLLVGIDSWDRASIVETADRVEKDWRQSPTDWIVVDDDGVGGGVTDVLESRGLPVVPFHNGGKADAPAKYANCATEAWWSVREGLESSILATKEMDYELELQLTTRDYETRPNGQLKLEKKEKYTKRTGFASPDRADAWAMAYWMVTRAWRGVRAA